MNTVDFALLYWHSPSEGKVAAWHAPLPHALKGAAMQIRLDGVRLVNNVVKLKLSPNVILFPQLLAHGMNEHQTVTLPRHDDAVTGSTVRAFLNFSRLVTSNFKWLSRLVQVA